MTRKDWFKVGAASGLIAGAAYVFWGRAGRKTTAMARIPPERAHGLLARAAPLLRLPSSPDRLPEVLPDGSGLGCQDTGRIYPYRDGVLDLLENELALTETQQLLNTALTAWAYDRSRDSLLRLMSMPTFAEEVAAIQSRLRLEPGDTVLDLACGHGNFTIEWAKRVGPQGLVIGLDISSVMLARAAHHINRWGLSNVLLIRGDAHHLPLADRVISKVNCSGGFHQFPDLPQALREIARVSTPNAVLTASTFAERPRDAQARLKRWFKRHFEFHFVPIDWLGDQLSALGYRDYDWVLPGGWLAYTSARKA